MTRAAQLLPWLLCVLLLGWSALGVTPVVPVEGDDQGVIFGLEGMVRQDQELLQRRYTYELQPGYYHLISGAARLTGSSATTAFATATVLGALAFAAAGARLLQKLLGWPLGWTLFAILWCQETTTAAFYLNTSTLGGAVALAGLLVALRPGRAAATGAGLCLALAGWLRADSLLIAPACLGLLYWRDGQWRPALLRTGAIAAVAVATYLALLLVSGATLAQGLTAYGERGFMLHGWRKLAETTMQMLSPVLTLVALPGLILIGRPGRRRLGVVFLTGVTASLLAHGSVLVTPKYFYYIIPFLLLPALLMIDAGVRSFSSATPRTRLWAGLGAGAMLLADGLAGVRTLAPEQRFFKPEPTLLTGFDAPWQQRRLAAVIGPGELVLNVDAFRLRTGQFFAPLCWRREKQRVQTDLATLRRWLAGRQDLTLCWANWLPRQLAERELLAAGFKPQKGTPAWHRGAQAVHLEYLGYADSDFPPPAGRTAALSGAELYFIGDRANRPLPELPDGRRWHLLSAIPEGLITLHQRR